MMLASHPPAPPGSFEHLNLQDFICCNDTDELDFGPETSADLAALTWTADDFINGPGVGEDLPLLPLQDPDHLDLNDLSGGLIFEPELEQALALFTFEAEMDTDSDLDLAFPFYPLSTAASGSISPYTGHNSLAAAAADPFGFCGGPATPFRISKATIASRDSDPPQFKYRVSKTLSPVPSLPLAGQAPRGRGRPRRLNPAPGSPQSAYLRASPESFSSLQSCLGLPALPSLSDNDRIRPLDVEADKQELDRAKMILKLVVKAKKQEMSAGAGSGANASGAAAGPRAWTPTLPLPPTLDTLPALPTPTGSESFPCAFAAAASVPNSHAKCTTAAGPFGHFLSVSRPVLTVGKKKPKTKKPLRQCAHCGTRKSPQWRSGPIEWGELNQSALCNRCGVKYRQKSQIPKLNYSPWAEGPAAIPLAQKTQLSHSNANADGLDYFHDLYISDM